MKEKRLSFLDAFRGVAVVMMILFHTCYDMRLLGMVEWDFTKGFWYYFPRFIAFSFLFCVGVSTHLTHTPQLQLLKLKKKLLTLLISAGLITLSTYLVFESQFIFFGTLHCIFLGTLIAALLARHRRILTGIMVLIVVLQYGFHFDIQWVSSIFNRPSLDFIPIYPWLWVILFGLFSAPYLMKNQFLRGLKSPKALTFLSQHSLKIYLLHQPLIYGFLYGFLWGIRGLL